MLRDTFLIMPDNSKSSEDEQIDFILPTVEHFKFRRREGENLLRKQSNDTYDCPGWRQRYLFPPAIYEPHMKKSGENWVIREKTMRKMKKRQKKKRREERRARRALKAKKREEKELEQKEFGSSSSSEVSDTTSGESSSEVSSTSSSSTDAAESSGSASSSISSTTSSKATTVSDRSVELPLGIRGKKKRAPSTTEKYKTKSEQSERGLVRKGNFQYDEFAKITGESDVIREEFVDFNKKGCPLCDGGTGKISREDMLFYETGKRFVERMKQSKYLERKGLRLLAAGSGDGEPFWVMNELQELEERLKKATGEQKEELDKKYKKKVQETMENMRSGIEEAALRYQAQRR